MSLTDNRSLSAEELLEQELRCFQEIVGETQTLVDDVDNKSADSLLSLFELRDHWVLEIKALEKLRKSAGIDTSNPRLVHLSKRISDLAKALVVTDAKLMDILQVQKIKTIKEMEKIVDIKSRSVQATRRNQAPRVLDTLAR